MAAPASSLAAEPVTYVAMGDSYTSGPLVLPHDQRWVPQDCGQSMRNYPHLSIADTGVWDAFIAQNPDAYDFVEYDVCVGDRIEDDTELKSQWETNAEYLGKRKIDVVGHTSDHIDIIEVKPSANARALGVIPSGAQNPSSRS